MARTSTVDEQFLALYEEHAARVHTFCVRLTGSRDDGADALQETFAAVYARLLDGVVLEHPRAYLLTAARHACLRRLGEHARVDVTDEVPEAVEAGVLPDGEREALTRDLQARVRAANERLPVRQREVLVLREVEGLSHEQIGEHMGLTPNAVAQLSWRARVNLREQVRADALRSIAPASIECEEALALLTLLEDGPLRPARQAWLDAHLEDCSRCSANRAAMAEAGAQSR
jgi:RNA polymerase sigma factor (sigma-70 family)